MKNLKSFLAYVFVTCLIFSSCTKNDQNSVPDPTTPPEEPAKIPIIISTEIQTRATITGFQNGDKVGLFVVNYNGETPGSLTNSGNHINNNCFTFSGIWNSESPIYWKDQSTKADFYCYFPYTSTLSNVTAYNFAVKKNQSTTADIRASDFLWGKTAGVSPTPNAVPISVKHIFSKLTINVIPGTGYGVSDIDNAVITICGLKYNSTINLTTGVVTSTGFSSDITPYKGSASYTALIVPQSIVNSQFIKIEINGNTYFLKQTMTFETNKAYTATITVNKTSNGINIGISDWDVDNHDYGGTVE